MEESFAAAVILFVLECLVAPIVVEAMARQERRWRQRQGIEENDE